MTQKNLDEFLSFFNKGGTHPVTEIDVSPSRHNDSPFIILRNGRHAMVVNPIALDDGSLNVDIHPFVDGKAATAGVFGMPRGRRVQFPATGTTSQGFPSVDLVAIVLGKQAEA